MTKTPLLSCEHLSFCYHTPDGETRALEDISFQVDQGTFLAIVGPSGCGKTTILSLIAGYLKPEEGEIKISTPDKVCSPFRVGYMLQQDQLLSWKTIYENVILGLRLNHTMTTENLAYVDTLLEQYGLKDF